MNAAIGGARNSAHVQGLAADINVPGYAPKALANLIKDSGIKFDQLILEFPNANGWVHIGLSIKPLRRQILTASHINGKTVYTEGLNA